jgi:hypothetical protein
MAAHPRGLGKGKSTAGITIGKSQAQPDFGEKNRIGV